MFDLLCGAFHKCQRQGVTLSRHKIHRFSSTHQQEQQLLSSETNVSLLSTAQTAGRNKPGFGKKMCKSLFFSYAPELCHRTTSTIS